METNESSKSTASEPSHAAFPEDAESRYQLVSKLATGATATVYKARHRLLESFVALKILHRIELLISHILNDSNWK